MFENRGFRGTPGGSLVQDKGGGVITADLHSLSTWRHLVDFKLQLAAWWAIDLTADGRGWIGQRLLNDEIDGPVHIVWHTTDGGSEWFPLGRFRWFVNGGVRDIRANGREVYILANDSLGIARAGVWHVVATPIGAEQVVGLQAGVWVGGVGIHRLDGLREWQSEALPTMADGLPVSDLHVFGGKLWAVGKDGLILYRDMPMPTVVADSGSLPTPLSQIQVMPNPFNAEATIELHLGQSIQDAELNLYNMLGQKEKCLSLGTLAPGPHRLPLNRLAESVASGGYVVSLESKSMTRTLRTRITVLK